MHACMSVVAIFIGLRCMRKRMWWVSAWSVCVCVCVTTISRCNVHFATRRLMAGITMTTCKHAYVHINDDVINIFPIPKFPFPKLFCQCHHTIMYTWE